MFSIYGVRQSLNCRLTFINCLHQDQDRAESTWHLENMAASFCGQHRRFGPWRSSRELCTFTRMRPWVMTQLISTGAPGFLPSGILISLDNRIPDSRFDEITLLGSTVGLSFHPTAEAPHDGRQPFHMTSGCDLGPTLECFTTSGFGCTDVSHSRLS
jgi:hypothetical protein